MKSVLVLPWLPPLRTRLDMSLYENPWILGPCTQQTISCPFKVHRVLVPRFLSCNVKYPVFLTCKTTAALHTFSPGLAINKGVFPTRQFVSLPSHPEWSVQLYSQHRLLWHSTVRKCPQQLCLELTSLTGSQCLVESCNAGLTPPLEQDSFCFLPPSQQILLVLKQGKLYCQEWGGKQETGNKRPSHFS